MALITYIGLYYLLDCDYLLQYEVGITVFYYLFHMESHMSFASAIPIGAFRWISQAILTKMGFSEKRCVIVPLENGLTKVLF